jgi:hypothetical protein
VAPVLPGWFGACTDVVSAGAARMEPDKSGLRVPVAHVHSAARATFAADDMTSDRKAFDLAYNGFYSRTTPNNPRRCFVC